MRYKCNLKIFLHNLLIFELRYVIIEKTDSGPYIAGAKKDIYLPYEQIVRVDFITDVKSKFYNFSGKHILKEIK